MYHEESIFVLKLGYSQLFNCSIQAFQSADDDAEKYYIWYVYYIDYVLGISTKLAILLSLGHQVENRY